MSGRIWTGAELTTDQVVDCDVCIVGSGAGGAVLAAGLAERGLDVVMLEEGGYRTRRDWAALDERVSYPMLYQERAARTTADGAIAVLQGRTVGGTTVVNWTTCFRTPGSVLDHWRERFGSVLDAEVLRPHWEAVEQRLNIHPWPAELVNRNNGLLLEGCRALGWQADILRRNVNGCANSGFCGLGCPVDGKQAMHLTYLPDAVANGLRLFANTRAVRLEREGRRITAVHARVLHDDRDAETGVSLTIRPRVTVVSGGAINSPLLLLKSGIDAGGRVGRRTFLHPTVAVGGEFAERVNGFYGAPQSVASHQFADRGPDEVGFFFEVSPLQPMLATFLSATGGGAKRAEMARLPHMVGAISLHIDGLLDGDEGGVVTARADGRPHLAYPITPRLQRAFAESHVRLAEVLFAAGAERATTGHAEPRVLERGDDPETLRSAGYAAFDLNLFTAHQMGGCTLSADPARGVVDPQLRVHGFDDLFVVDGSVFPTAAGVNPSLSIYGLAHWARDAVAAAV